MTVTKRNDQMEKLSKRKIYQSICNANNATEEKYRLAQSQIQKISDSVFEHCQTLEDPINIDILEDLIENKIMEASGYEVAKRYIKYRYEKERVRNNKALTEKLTASNVQNQNANVDEFSFGGRIGEAASYMMKEYALQHLISKKSRQNHLNNEIYIHDLDHYAVGDHNCLSIPFDKLLAEGFNTRQTDVRPAGSISTAFQLVAVIFQLQSLQQFGGVSATHLDWTMVPYVRKSFWKHFKDGLHYIRHADILNKFDVNLSIEDDFYKSKSDAYQYALDKTEQELDQAVEGMYHNLNTLQSRSGNQLPFTSINFGTCTLSEGRMVIKALLDGCINGVGKYHRTAIFPCGIFQCMKGVNQESGEPNYDLFRLALKSTAMRIYPNYANVDWSGNEGYDPENPETYFSTMGALAGHEHLYVKIDNSDVIDLSIKDFFDFCKNGTVNNHKPTKIIFNLERQLNKGNRKIQNKYGLELKPGVYSITYIPQDVTYFGSSNNICRCWAEHKSHIHLYGTIDGGCSFNDNNDDNYRFDVIEYTDNYKEREKEFILKESNINFKGISQKYYKNNIGYKDKLEKPNFKFNTSFKQELIDLTDKNIMVLDRDNKWVKVLHVFKNDKHNTPRMMHVYYKEYDRTCSLSCTEDHPLWTGTCFTKVEDIKPGMKIYRADNLEMEVVKVTYHWELIDSYDIGTVSGSFIGSDIIMHNCRTANGKDINQKDSKLYQLKDGRGNISPVTIIMPTLAMEARECIDDNASNYQNEIIEKFFKILDKKINEARDMLLERFDWQCSQSYKSAKFMYENGLIYGYNPEEGIRSALKHGTLVVGQLGLAETLQILIGKDHTTQDGMNLAKRIEQLFKDKCAKFKKDLKLNFGVYYTPAENLSYTAMNRFREKYGVIKNVSDKKYFTNSIHIPVWHKMDAFEKIDLESQLTGYSNAGCITYVELDSDSKNNIDALEKLVKYAMNKDIPYFAINTCNDLCRNCGYQGEINDKCPQCGSDKIDRLRRVTGYITGNYKTAFNEGKQEETEMRVKHTGLDISESN